MAYPQPGLGATNVNAVQAQSMTLDINVGDCVVIFVNSNATSISVGDNGSTSNTYTLVGNYTPGSGWGNAFAYVCLSAAYSATTVTVTGGTNYCMSGATFTGVQNSAGAIHKDYASGTAPTNPVTGAVTTTANDSLVVAGATGQQIQTFTATSGTKQATSVGTVVSAALFTQQVATSGTVATTSAIITTLANPYSFDVFSLELLASTTNSTTNWVSGYRDFVNKHAID